MTVQECYEAMGADYDDVISRLRTDERVTKFLLKILNDGSFQLLTDSLAAKNMEDAFRAAHTLKGVAMNLSLTALYHAAGPMTEALRGRAFAPCNEICAKNSRKFQYILSKIFYILSTTCYNTGVTMQKEFVLCLEKAS